ncbi:MAG: hypothetical protein LBC30_03955 [Puniceicoccales bacterium]|jgi:hypothetical protein|nr:hypothetical protein [Puniceicoccales bacterium]
MTKKLLLNLINSVLLVSFCNMGKAIGAASRFPQKRGDSYLDERRAMRDLQFEGEKKFGNRKRKAVKPEKSGRSRSVEPTRKAELPPPPLPQEETRKVVQVICNKRVLDVIPIP